MQAVYTLLAVGIGIQFPGSAMDQFNSGQVWSVVSGATIEGGHYVSVTGRRAPDDIGLITWGRRQGMTRSFYTKYCDEAWGFISQEELKNGKNVRGFDYASLQEALQQLKRSSAGAKKVTRSAGRARAAARPATGPKRSRKR